MGFRGRGQEHSQPLLCLVCQRPGRRRTRAGRISVRVLCCHGRRLDVAGCCRRDFEAVVCQRLDPQFPFTGTERREQRSVGSNGAKRSCEQRSGRLPRWTPRWTQRINAQQRKKKNPQKKKKKKKKKKI